MRVHFEIVASHEAWQDARRVRQRVFVEEQACPPAEEWDRFDAESRHIVGYALAGGDAVAVSRWREVEHAGALAARIERVAVVPEARGGDVGRRLFAFTLKDAARAGHRRFYIHAQAYLQEFYERFGFRAFGERFEEVGIPHVEMLLERDAAP